MVNAPGRVFVVPRRTRGGQSRGPRALRLQNRSSEQGRRRRARDTAEMRGSGCGTTFSGEVAVSGKQRRVNAVSFLQPPPRE